MQSSKTARMMSVRCRSVVVGPLSDALGAQAVTRAMRDSGLDSSSFEAFCSTKSKRTRVKGAVTPSDS